MKIVFDVPGDFESSHAAELWCERRGISVGRMQGPDPRGLLVGDFEVAKWRNLHPDQRRGLDGQMTGDMRRGPVTVELRGVEADYPLVDENEASE